MNETKINNLTGWGVFLVALVVYLLTVAPTASFWDCGEFIACSNELEVTHPPGAPLFLLLGRIMAMLSFGDVTNIAFMINLLSVLSGAFTALFTCWSITMLAKKGLARSDMDSQAKLIATMAAGAVGGLTCIFADSIWFNAVEAEVYSMSSFFTAIVVWLMLKWEARADEPDHFRWIILIAYVMGLSIGVHLLNLLTIPALAVIYYFRKFEFSVPGLLATLGISVVILAVVQYGIIQYSFSIAWSFEKLFTGTITRDGADAGGLGMPMGTGSMVFFLLLIGTIAGLLFYSHRQKKIVLNTAMLALSVIIIGFSSYAVIFTRSAANPPIDMNNPENILSFLSYMKREQYGDRPLLRGTLYNGRVDVDARGYAKTELKGMKYTVLEGTDKYIEDTEDIDYIYRDEDMVWFPRMYEVGRYNSGPFGYINFVQRTGADPRDPMDDKPTRAEDFTFFLQYQLNHMYIRYFMWNFVGRTSDIQEAGWEDGLLINSSRNTQNKGKNHYYFLPLLLGFMGLIWQSVMSKRDAFVVGMLFFFTGIAIIIYLNQYPLQPRERDYSYAGSFQTFCIWIGLGVLFLTDLLRKYLKNLTPWIAGGLALIAPVIMMAENLDDHTRKGRWIDIEFAKNLLNSCEKNAILFTGGDNDTFPLWYIQEVEGFRTDVRVVNLELLISDWYIEQMQEQKNDSPPLPITMKKEDYVGEQGLVIRGVTSQDVKLPVNKEALISQGLLNEREARLVADPMVWEFKGKGGQRNPYILRKDSVVLNIVRNVAYNNWERPIYFANTMPPANFANLNDWLRMEGFAFRVIPVKKSEETSNDIYHGRIAQEIMFKNMTEKFLYTGLDDPSVNLDEHIRNVILGNYRNSFFRLANSHTDDILKLNQENQTLSLALGVAGGNQDSIQARINQNRMEILRHQARIEEIIAFSEEKMPHAVNPRNLTLLITQGQMMDQIGLKDMAYEEFMLLKEVSMRNLETLAEEGVKLDQNNMSLRGAAITIQFLVRNGYDAEAQELSDFLTNTTGIPIGESIIQQERGGQ
ncbi:MAG: DUF2723 domain-containing protein [Bacteroidia bacterium]